jgi:uncharacterized RDD family membrane protein YckC
MARRAFRARQRKSGAGQGPRVVPPASIRARAAAFVSDIFVSSVLVGSIIGAVPWPLSGLFSVAGVTLMFVMLWTGPVGQSYGQRFLRLQVIGTDGDSLGFGRALLRFVALVGGTLLFFVGPASALADERRQAWHDKVARSYVVGLESFDESIRDLDRAMVDRSEWRPRPIVVTPQKALPLIVVLLVAAVPSSIVIGVVMLVRILAEL